MFWYPKNIKEFDIQEIPTKIKRIFNRNDNPSSNKFLVSFVDREAQSILVSGGKGSSLAMLRTIQESESRSQFFDKKVRSHQILNALVDQVSTNPLKRSIRVEALISEKQKRQRAGSIATAIFPDPHDFDVPEFHVPQGFIVSVSALERHLTDNPEIKKILNELEDVTSEKIAGDFKEICGK